MRPVPAPPAPARAWRFDELVDEALAIIPAWAPEWSDHNPSDPGIAVVELLAYYAEILAYRALRVTPDAELALLNLLTGRPDETLIGVGPGVLAERLREAVARLARPQAAVTPADFERLAVASARDHLGRPADVLARCLPGAGLRDARAEETSQGEVTVVLWSDAPPEDAAELCAAVADGLAPCCLLTTRVHVTPAAVLDVQVGGRLALRPGAETSRVEEAVDLALRRRFSPLRPSAQSPFGRPLHMGEVIATIDEVEGVDYVEAVRVHSLSDARSPSAQARVGVRIGEVGQAGVDARLGGAASVARRRFETDATGEPVTVLAQPWELLNVSFARAGAADGSGGVRS